MADIGKQPENYHQKIETPPAVIKTAESLGISQKSAGTVLEAKGKALKVLDEADSITWSKEERMKLKEELLIGELRKKLIAKYPEQKEFFMKAKIKVMQLGDNYERHNLMVNQIGGNIFLLFSPNGKLLSYLNSNGTTNFDISSFNFDNDFGNLLNKKLSKKNGNSYILTKDGNLFLYDPTKNIYYPEGSIHFNVYIFAFYLKTLK